MEVSKYIKNEAEGILAKNQSLPQQIISAPQFYVAEASDDSVLAFTLLEHEGSNYKIGTKK